MKQNTTYRHKRMDATCEVIHRTATMVKVIIKEHNSFRQFTYTASEFEEAWTPEVKQKEEVCHA